MQINFPSSKLATAYHHITNQAVWKHIQSNIKKLV